MSRDVQAAPSLIGPLWPGTDQGAVPSFSKTNAGEDPASLLIALLGLAALFIPTYWDLAFGIWRSYGQGHETLILAVSAWLLFRKRDALRELSSKPSHLGGGALLAIGLLLYLLGRTQQLLRVEMISLVVVLAAVLLLYRGIAAWRLTWFPLLFLLFSIPLPYSFVMSLTAPLKLAVSVVASWLLFWAGFPVGRSGVVITIGQYQMLVAEACAGLQTMFTLEAMGLLYGSLKNYRSWVRNAILALVVIPVAFSANVVRVLVVVLVTYYFGEAAGQGFIHGFAGMLLFAVALLLIMGVDKLLSKLLPPRLAT